MVNSKYSGCLLGGAVGDALGAPVEFLMVRQIVSRYGEEGIRDFVEHPGGIGEFTDDTQMTLFTAEALLRARHREIVGGPGGGLAEIARQSYTRWLFTQGEKPDGMFADDEISPLESGWLIRQEELHKRRAPGNSCLNSLRSGGFGRTNHPVNNSKGCGAVMRMAPVGLVMATPEEAFEAGCNLGALTHGHPTGYLCAGAFAAIIQQLAAGSGLVASIAGTMDILRGWPGHKETLEAMRLALELHFHTRFSEESDLHRMSGWIARLGAGWTGEEALSIALFCSLSYEYAFRQGVLAAVNHSGDSDSTGAITGNILGLINGIDSIPSEWLDNLLYADIVREMADDLHTVCQGSMDEADEEWREKYPGY